MPSPSKKIRVHYPGLDANLVAACDAAGVTRTVLARSVGIGTEYIGDISSGMPIEPSTVVKFAAALGLTVTQLIEGEVADAKAPQVSSPATPRASRPAVTRGQGEKRERYCNLADHLKHACEAAGDITYSDLAGLAGITRHQMVDIRRGLPMAPSIVEAVAQALGLTAAQLAEGDVNEARLASPSNPAPPFDPVSLAQHLKRARETAGLTVKQLSEMSGQNGDQIANLERMRVLKPKPAIVSALEAALSLPPGALRSGVVEAARPNPRLLPGPHAAPEKALPGAVTHRS